jgi:hypothetical protein
MSHNYILPGDAFASPAPFAFGSGRGKIKALTAMRINNVTIK